MVGRLPCLLCIGEQETKKTLALLAKNREGSSQCCGLALLLFMLKNLGYDEFENYTCTYSLGSLPQEIPVLDDSFFVIYEFPAVHHFGIWLLL